MGNTPNIRFKGFTDDWEQRKLGDWGDFYYGRSCPKWSVTEDATIPCIRYGELYTKFGAKIDRVYSYTNMPPENLRFSKGTEVLIPRVGENPMDYNHCTWLSMKDVAIGEMISVFNTDNNPLFTATMFNATLQNEFAMRVEGGSVTNLYFEKLKNIDVSFPSIREQEMIAAYFENIDNLITLHQRKCDETKKLKKFMLQKMFPKKDAKKPEIRFAGFTNDWEQRKLGDWGDFYYGRSCPKWSVTEDATIPCIRYGELYTKFGAKIDRVYSYTNMPPENLRFSKGTEVLIPRVGENPMDYNHCTWLSMKDVAIGEMISVFNTDNNPLFTATMFNATLQNEFAMRVEGGSVTNLYFEKLKNIDVSFPSIREQEMIAAYFENIDNLITLHQRKCDETKKLKKFMLQKMFPKKDAKKPEIRFAGFTNDWEQRKLMEVAEYRNGKAHENEINDDGEYIVVNSKFVSTNGEIRKFSYAQNEPLYENEIAFVLSDVPNGRAIARTFLVDKSGKYTLNQRIAGITPHEDTDPYYLYIKMNRNEYFLKFDDGNKQTNLSIKDVLNYEDMYPSYKEQQKIGMYFQQLDHLITLHQRAYYNKKGGLTNVHNDNQQYYAIL